MNSLFPACVFKSDNGIPPGLTWEETKRRCPPGVVAACHNAEETQTISGPAEDVAQFVEELKSEGVFAREVKSAGVAFHSYYMQQVAPSLRAALDKVCDCVYFM